MKTHRALAIAALALAATAPTSAAEVAATGGAGPSDDAITRVVDARVALPLAVELRADLYSTTCGTTNGRGWCAVDAYRGNRGWRLNLSVHTRAGKCRARVTERNGRVARATFPMGRGCLVVTR
jgi:hypothetical protein